MLTTTGLHTLLAGATGSGKTVAARRIVARALLDPTVRIVMIDGKGSAADWAGLLPMLAEPLVQVGQPDLGRRAVQLLTRVRELGQRHDAQRHRANPPGCLVVVEEWAAFRSAVPAGAERRDLDEAMRTLLQVGRSAGTHVLLIAQRPTQSSLPTDQAANVRQRLVVPCASDEEASHALGEWPIVANLRRPGAGLLVNAEPQRQVQVDNMTDAVWEALCARAAALRGIGRPVQLVKSGRPVQLVKATPEPVPAAAAEVALSPLLEAVCELLEQDGARGLPAEVLLELLPADVRPANAARLGRALAAAPTVVAQTWIVAPGGRPVVAGGRRRSVQVWQLTARATPAQPGSTPALPPRSAVVTPALPPRTTAVTPAQPCSTPARSPRAGGKSGQTDRLVPAQGGEAPLPADTPGQ